MLYEQIEKVIAPYRDRVIVCLETAADYMGYSNGVMTETLFRVFSMSEIDDDRLVVEVISESAFKSKSVVSEDLVCTDFGQTVLDLLEYSSDVDIQTLLEAMSNYYFEHGKSFEPLEQRMTPMQKVAFDRWRGDAIEYYTER